MKFVVMTSSEFDVWKSGDISLQIWVFFYLYSYLYHLEYGLSTYYNESDIA